MVTIDTMFLDVGDVGRSNENVCSNKNVVVNLCSNLLVVGFRQGVEKLKRCWLRYETWESGAGRFREILNVVQLF